MSLKKAKTPKSFNSQVFTLACNRLKLKRREKTIFYRLLGFLIRNERPFPYSINALVEVTGYARRTIFESLSVLIKYRLIDRVGYTSRIKFAKGPILNRICTLVRNRIKNKLKSPDDLEEINTLVQKPHEFFSASADFAPNKTSSSLKRKEGEFFFTTQNKPYYEYVRRIETDRKLNLASGNVEILTLEEWIKNDVCTG